MITLQLSSLEAVLVQTAIDGYIRTEINHTNPNELIHRRDLVTLEKVGRKLLTDRVDNSAKEADPCL